LVRHVGLLREALRVVRAKRPFTFDAIVILPDHLHTIWTLPEGDTDYSGRWRTIKAHFPHNLKKSGVPLMRDKRGEYLLWQRRFWEHTIRDDNDFNRHVDYIHWNPVKHELTKHPADWPYSSYHRYIRLGLLPNDWSNSVNKDQNRYGE
jgi:putative transposase